MTGIERRQFEMLIRVRNFSRSHTALFIASPIAQQTFAVVSTAVDDLTAENMAKMSAAGGVRGDPRKAARRALTAILHRASRLARELDAERTLRSEFVMPSSRSDVSLITAGRQFAVDAARFEAEFSGHGMSPGRITALTDALERAIVTQGLSRTRHVAARARIADLLDVALSAVRRLDLIVANNLADDSVVQAQWRQLRRREEPRTSRNRAQPAPAEQTADARVTPMNAARVLVPFAA